MTFRAADDVADLLLPFIRQRSVIDDDFVEELYRRCSLGEFSSVEFWHRVGIEPGLEDEYLRAHALIDNARDFIIDARNYFDALWYLSNDVSEWSVKLRRMFALEELFDGFIISGDVHSRKPAPKIYHALLAASGCKAEEVLFVDDRPKNVHAALTLGMNALLFGSHADPASELRRVEDFAELRELLFDSS